MLGVSFRVGVVALSKGPVLSFPTREILVTGREPASELCVNFVREFRTPKRSSVRILREELQSKVTFSVRDSFAPNSRPRHPSSTYHGSTTDRPKLNAEKAFGALSRS